MSDEAWIRTRPGPRESATALAAAVLVGTGTALVTWWFARTLLNREPVTLRPERLPPPAEGPGRLP